MSPTHSVLLLVLTALIVIIRVVMLVLYRWDYPTADGPAYFLRIPVSPEFSDAQRGMWLRRYRSFLVTEHVLETLAAGLLAFSPWRGWLPAWAGGVAVVDTLGGAAFQAWARRSIPQAAAGDARVAVSLDSRRVGDYTSWTLTVALLASLAVAWWLLVFHGIPGWQWPAPAVWTYFALAAFVWKVNAVVAGETLPADRPAEHQRWFDERRRFGVRTLECAEWLGAVVVMAYAARHSVPGAALRNFVTWAAVAATLAIGAYMAVHLIRGVFRLAASGRGLQVPGIWSGFPGVGGRGTRLLGLALSAGLVVLVAVGYIQLSK
jgi:hypothetical protein